MDIVAVYSAICEADARWVDQYLREIERLGFKFAMHFDRCGADLRNRITGHPMCLGYTSSDKPFTEKHKQGALDIAAKNARWGLAWDVDETWDKDAPINIRKSCASKHDYIMFGWVNLWGDAKHVRTDGPMKCLRHKLSRFGRRRRWVFMSAIVNGPTLFEGNTVKDYVPYAREWSVVCLHWGLMTRELREEHKARWDNVYANPECGGTNPYGIWSWALDEETYPPTVVEHDYL